MFTIILTSQHSMSCSAQFRAIIMNCEFSLPCTQLLFISFGFGRGLCDMKTEACEREYVPAGCHDLSLPFEIFRKNTGLQLSPQRLMHCTDITG